MYLCYYFLNLSWEKLDIDMVVRQLLHALVQQWFGIVSGVVVNQILLLVAIVTHSHAPFDSSLFVSFVFHPHHQIIHILSCINN